MDKDFISIFRYRLFGIMAVVLGLEGRFSSDSESLRPLHNRT